MATSYPWLTTMALATGKDDVNWLKDTMGPKPKADLSLEHVHPYSGSLSKQNILYLTRCDPFQLRHNLYCTSLDSNRQKFFRHHTEFVTAFALFKPSKQSGGSAQDGANPRVCIWNTETMHCGRCWRVSTPNVPLRAHFPLFLHSGAEAYPSQRWQASNCSF